MKAINPRPTAATTPISAIEVLRKRTSRPSPARLEPTTERDSSFRALDSTTRPSAIEAGQSKRRDAKTQYWVDDPLSSQ